MSDDPRGGAPGEGGDVTGATGDHPPGGHGSHGGSHGDHGAPIPPIGWMDRPDKVKLFFRSFYVICALLIVGELIFGKETEHPHPYEWPPFFYAIYGFVSFWFLVLVARPMRSLLIRSEDYYDE